MSEEKEVRQRTDFIILHCSATPPNMDIGAKDIDLWHRQRGFLKIGYHYVIKRDGTREVGRELNETGAHCLAYNHKSVGVCMVGGVDRAGEGAKAENNFTEAQWTTLKLTVDELRDQYKDAFVVGHRDLQAGKECPSFDVKRWMDGMDRWMDDAET